MKITKSRQELKIEINWNDGKADKDLSIGGLIILGSFIFEYLFFGHYFTGSSSTILLSIISPITIATFFILIKRVRRGSSLVQCYEDVLIISNNGKRKVFNTNKIAQFYLSYVSSRHGLNVFLRNKDDEDYDCFNARVLVPEKARELEEALEKFLGIEDYYIDGEYQTEGHQKSELKEQVNTYTPFKGEVFSEKTIEGIIDKKFQYEWNNGTIDHLYRLNTGGNSVLIYKSNDQLIQEQTINKTYFLEQAELPFTIDWDRFPMKIYFEKNSYILEEENEGQFFSNYVEKQEIKVEQKLYSFENQWIRIAKYSDIKIEISTGITV